MEALLRSAEAVDPADAIDPPPAAELAAFVGLIMADGMDRAYAIADRFTIQCGSRQTMLNQLLTPAARLLGEMWHQDTCDFLSVTLGVHRLDRIMKETTTAATAQFTGHEYRILLLPAPGEQHSFGLGMVADAFREGGWSVRSGPAISTPKLLRLVRREWFDIVGFSVSAARHLTGLAASVRALRAASRNPNIHVMLGGNAVTADEERARFIGADAIAQTAQGALAAANFYLTTTVTESLRQSMTRLVDVG